jgi:hypothetical protein
VSDPNERTCAATGYRLVAAQGELAYRVALDRYVNSSGILGVLVNEFVGWLPPGEPERRGRYDTVGRTVYLGRTVDVAMAEVLMAFRMSRTALAVDAAAIEPEPGEKEVTVDEFIDQVTKEALENGRDTPWAISADWQMDRSLFHVRMPLEGWWVRLDHSDTIDALSDALLDSVRPYAALDDPTARVLTLGDVAGQDRGLTTWIAQLVRDAVLDDGSLPLGIDYPSKTGAGRCLAYWPRRLDDGLTAGHDDPSITHYDNVCVPGFYERARKWGLPVLPGRYLGHV